MSNRSALPSILPWHACIPFPFLQFYPILNSPQLHAIRFYLSRRGTGKPLLRAISAHLPTTPLRNVSYPQLKQPTESGTLPLVVRGISVIRRSATSSPIPNGTCPHSSYRTSFMQIWSGRRSFPTPVGRAVRSERSERRSNGVFHGTDCWSSYSHHWWKAPYMWVTEGYLIACA